MSNNGPLRCRLAANVGRSRLSAQSHRRNQLQVSPCNPRRGKTKSCGCFVKENRVKHGAGDPPLTLGAPLPNPPPPTCSSLFEEWLQLETEMRRNQIDEYPPRTAEIELQILETPALNEDDWLAKIALLTHYLVDIKGSPGNQHTGPLARDEGTRTLADMGISYDQSSRRQDPRLAEAAQQNQPLTQ
jgi:hypothetical protein